VVRKEHAGTGACVGLSCTQLQSRFFAVKKQQLQLATMNAASMPTALTINYSFEPGLGSPVSGHKIHD
jgi:hypothetical protein